MARQGLPSTCRNRQMQTDSMTVAPSLPNYLFTKLAFLPKRVRNWIGIAATSSVRNAASPAIRNAAVRCAAVLHAKNKILCAHTRNECAVFAQVALRTMALEILSNLFQMSPL